MNIADDVIRSICLYLKIEDISQLRLNKQWNNAINYNVLWYELLIRDFNYQKEKIKNKYYLKYKSYYKDYHNSISIKYDDKYKKYLEIYLFPSHFVKYKDNYKFVIDKVLFNKFMEQWFTDNISSNDIYKERIITNKLKICNIDRSKSCSLNLIHKIVNLYSNIFDITIHNLDIEKEKFWRDMEPHIHINQINQSHLSLQFPLGNMRAISLSLKRCEGEINIENLMPQLLQIELGNIFTNRNMRIYINNTFNYEGTRICISMNYKNFYKIYNIQHRSFERDFKSIYNDLIFIDSIMTADNALKMFYEEMNIETITVDIVNSLRNKYKSQL